MCFILTLLIHLYIKISVPAPLHVSVIVTGPCNQRRLHILQTQLSNLGGQIYAVALQDTAFACESAVCHTYHRLPAEHQLGFSNIGSSSLRVVLGLWEELDLTSAHCVCEHARHIMNE